MRTTKIDVKFDEESKSEVRIGLPCKEKPEYAENCRKIIKLLLEKNDVKKYLEEHQKRQLLAPDRCPQTREHSSFLNFPPFLEPIGAN